MAEVIDISIENNPSPEDIVVDFASSYSSVTVVNPDVNAKTGQAADAKATYEALNMKANKADIPSVDLSDYATKTDVNNSLSKKADKSELDSYAKTSYVDDKLKGKQDVLTAGTNITILNGVISAAGGGSGSSIELSKPSADGAGKAADAKETYLALEKKLDNGTGTNVVIGQSASSDPDKNNVAIGALATVGSTEGRGVAVGHGAAITNGERVVAIGAGVSAGDDTPIVIGSRDDSRIVVRKDGTMTVGGKALAVRESVNSALGNKVDVSVFDSTINGVNNNVSNLRKNVGEFFADVSAELTEVKATIVANASSVNTALSGVSATLGQKQNKLTAGANITILGDVISATGSLSPIVSKLISEDGTRRLSVDCTVETDTVEVPVITTDQYLTENEKSYLYNKYELILSPAAEQPETSEGWYLYNVSLYHHWEHKEGFYTGEYRLNWVDAPHNRITLRVSSDGVFELDPLVARLNGASMQNIFISITAIKTSDNSVRFVFGSSSRVEYGVLDVTFNFVGEIEKAKKTERLITDETYNELVGSKIKVIRGREPELDDFDTHSKPIYDGNYMFEYDTFYLSIADDWATIYKYSPGGFGTPAHFTPVFEFASKGSGGGISQMMIETTHAELKSLRDNGELIPGMQYRITDYVATVGEGFYTGDPAAAGESQDVAVSAGHEFDIVVTATSSNVLDEVARALRHNGDTYFPETTKFEAWKLWYCVDNDVRRFLWADEENGKGVIYRMIDERNNDVPYDFKSIQSIPSAASNKYFESVYVFSSGYEGGDDESLNMDRGVYNNKISPAYGVHEVTAENEETGEIEVVEQYRAQKLNLIHITGDVFCHDNVFSMGCEKDVISGSCNHFGEYCLNNFVVGSYNRFGNDCANNRLETKCSSNTFGNSCYNNTLEGSDIRCSFGNGASENIIPSYCRALTLQNDVRSMELILPSGTDYYRNVEFKSGLRAVTIEDTREDNTHGYKVFKPQNSDEYSVPYDV